MIKPSRCLAALTFCLALVPSLTAAQNPADTTQTLRVFLQGGSAAELKALVEAHGGTVTHDLHIIDAVGAVLSPIQLEEILRSPLVQRHIDDLAVSTPPEKDKEEGNSGCDVGGSLELGIESTGIRWRLYNKEDTPATVKSLKLAWPAQLGNINHLSLAGKDIDPTLYRNSTAGAATLKFGNTPAQPAPVLAGNGDLRIDFSSTASQPLRQRAFELEANFSGGCSTELIPGYDDNHEDFHYSAVAGADALQIQGVTGKGITVAIIDSGLWETPDLTRDTGGKNRILARYNGITDSTGNEVFDESGHGTHMTSIIAHSGATTRQGKPTGTYKGIAPDISLVVVKAFDVEGHGDFLDIVRAVQWVVDHRETYDIRVLNLSFAALPRWNYWLDPINQAVMRAWASGIAVVAAAGNEGPEPMTIGSPGNLPYVITVGAVTDSWTPENRDDDYIPDFSSRGPTPSAHIKPDIVAPGGHITGITRPGSSLVLEHPEYMLSTGEFVMSGSSQASAVVSGMAALLLQLEPDLSPDDIKCKLMTSAEPAISRNGLLAYSPFQQGHGYANVTRAVIFGERGCGNADTDIRADISDAEHYQGPAIVDSDGKPGLPGLGSMVSSEPSEKGMSTSRKWGVKAHIERLESPFPAATDPVPDSGTTPPFDWMQLYLKEKSTIENLSREDYR